MLIAHPQSCSRKMTWCQGWGGWWCWRCRWWWPWYWRWCWCLSSRSIACSSPSLSRRWSSNSFNWTQYILYKPLTPHSHTFPFATNHLLLLKLFLDNLQPEKQWICMREILLVHSLFYEHVCHLARPCKKTNCINALQWQIQYITYRIEKLHIDYI